MSTILEQLVKRYVNDLKGMSGDDSFMEYFRKLKPAHRKVAAQCFMQMGGTLRAEILKCKHENTEEPYPDYKRCKDCGATRHVDKEATEFSIWPTWTEWTI